MFNIGGANQTGAMAGANQTGATGAAPAGMAGYPFQSGPPPGLMGGASPTLPNMQAQQGAGLMGGMPPNAPMMQRPAGGGLPPAGLGQLAGMMGGAPPQGIGSSGFAGGMAAQPGPMAGMNPYSMAQAGAAMQPSQLGVAQHMAAMPPQDAFGAAQAGVAIQPSQLGQSQLGVAHQMAPMPAGGMFGPGPSASQGLGGQNLQNLFNQGRLAQANGAMQPPQFNQSLFGPRPPMNNMGGNQQLGGPSQFGFPQGMAGGAGQQAQGLAGLGRGGDSTLVHMSPNEVGGLQKLAMAAGGSLTQNPHTGLPEAGFLSSVLPMVAGAVLAPFTGGASAALIVAAEEAIRQKDWKKGLMAGLGAYGGAGLGSALEGAAGAGVGSAATDAATTTAADTAATTAASPTLAATAAPTTSAAADAAAGNASTLGSTYSQMAAPSTFQMAGTGAGATPVVSSATSATAPELTYQEHMARMGQGIGNLGDKGTRAAVASQVGRVGAAEMAAPALYSAMNPDPIKTTPPPPPKYWRAAPGYSSLYNPTTHSFNPGVFSTEFPGMAAGGTVSAADQAQMAKYQAMMNTPNTAMAPPPPPPTAMNNYLAGLQHQATTYTPPSVAAPMASPFETAQGGPGGGPGRGPPTYNPNFPPGSRMYGIDMNKLVNGGYNAYDFGGLYGKYANPNYSPYGHEPGGGRRAAGGIISLLGGGQTNGPGDGVSDSIPAMIDGHQPAQLAKGEFVIPARIVSELGNGSTDAGSQRLYEMMHKIEHARKHVNMSGDSKSYKKMPV